MPRTADLTVHLADLPRVRDALARSESLLRRSLERLAAANAVAGPDAATDQLLVDICDAIGEEPHPETLARLAAPSASPLPDKQETNTDG